MPESRLRDSPSRRRGPHQDSCRCVGADHVIDHTAQDFTTAGTRYDVVFDVVGTSFLSRPTRVLNRNGRFLLANPGMGRLLRGNRVSRELGVTVRTDERRTEDLVYLRGLVEAGRRKTIIDRRFSLEDTALAHRYVESGRKAGNVVIRIIPAREPL
ncbi:MAG: hypothetical protein E4H09_04360 [Spirochaetales bacterium]|nr:MAG: hypothetical protein E4H09_04360 [Spirochaetales bacterium]